MVKISGNCYSEQFVESKFNTLRKKFLNIVQFL